MKTWFFNIYVFALLIVSVCLMTAMQGSVYGVLCVLCDLDNMILVPNTDPLLIILTIAIILNLVVVIVQLIKRSLPSAEEFAESNNDLIDFMPNNRMAIYIDPKYIAETHTLINYQHHLSSIDFAN